MRTQSSSSGNSQLDGDRRKVKSTAIRTGQEINLSVKGALWQDRSALPSHSLCFQFLASSPTSAAFTLPCLACHEMAHFANTLLLSGPSSCGMYLLCFPRWCLCLPHGPLLSLLFQQVSQGLLFQEDGPTASALSKLVFLSTYSL